MSWRSVIISIGIALTFTVYVEAQSNAVSRCFQFTWLGAAWNNESIFMNATCSDATRLANGVPCVQPLVVSYDGTWPDVDYIWQNHPDASCILPVNGVCAKYTYFFNGHVENSTHFCTRAVDNVGNAITSGCYEHVNGSSTTRVCFCRSAPGGVPCNSSILPSINYLTIALITTAFVLQIITVNMNI